MQVYRHLDIGTSKPTRQERERVPHHLIDIVDPDEEFSAALFSRQADGIIGDLHGRKTVIVAGGTGLYIRALTGGIIEGPGPDEGLRKIFRDRLESEDRETLYARLEAIDPGGGRADSPPRRGPDHPGPGDRRTGRGAHLRDSRPPRIPGGAIRVPQDRTLPGPGGALPPDRQPRGEDDRGRPCRRDRENPLSWVTVKN